MPRRARVIVPGIAHHVTQRGNNRQPVFYSLDHRRLYLDLLIRQARRHGTKIAGYCLMTNHVHLVAVPEHENSLARTFGHTHAEYAQAMNQAAKRTGHVWQNRFFSCPLDSAHLESALRYVELNPVRAGLVVMPWEWLWSSARAHCLEGAVDALLDLSGRTDGWDHNGWREGLLAGMSEEDCGAVRRATRTGEPWGSREFLQQLESRAGRRLRVLARGRPVKRPNRPDARGAQQRLFDADV